MNDYKQNRLQNIHSIEFPPQRNIFLCLSFFLDNFSNNRNFAASNKDKAPSNSPKGENTIRDKAYSKDNINIKENNY